MTKSVIITAGGSGVRMGANIPKQFLEVASRPILMWTIEKFHQALDECQIIVTLPKNEINRWNELCRQHSFQLKHEVVPGGDSRTSSVRNGLIIATGDLIAVHDGVRPCVSSAMIKATFQAAEKMGSAVPVIEMVSSLRQTNADSNTAVNRADYKVVQTPQVFPAEVLKCAYEEAGSKEETDDATLVEKLGVEIHLVDGDPENIKITTDLDLKFANLMLNS